MTELLDIESMRQLDTGSLVTLKQRIERELMRRGDVEQSELTQRESPFELDGTGPEFIPAAPNTPTPLATRKLLREPDPGCTRCWGRGIKLSTQHTTVCITELCSCLWGGE